jgi:hypothetical protein
LAMFSFTEAIEFLDVHAAFRRETPAGLRRRLRDALQGPADPADESPASNHARNVMFELNLASRLRSQGLPVGLPENPDVRTDYRGVPIFIQCKRPFRETTVRTNIDDAGRQLTRDLAGATDQRVIGVIAISASRAFNPGNLLYKGATEAAVRRGLGDEVQRLGERHRDAWGAIEDARIVGILFHIISPTVVENIALLTVAQATVVFPLPGRPHADIELLDQLTTAIGSG